MQRERPEWKESQFFSQAFNSASRARASHRFTLCTTSFQILFVLKHQGLSEWLWIKTIYRLSEALEKALENIFKGYLLWNVVIISFLMSPCQSLHLYWEASERVLLKDRVTALPVRGHRKWKLCIYSGFQGVGGITLTSGLKACEPLLDITIF